MLTYNLATVAKETDVTGWIHQDAFSRGRFDGGPETLPFSSLCLCSLSPPGGTNANKSHLQREIHFCFGTSVET